MFLFDLISGQGGVEAFLIKAAALTLEVCRVARLDLVRVVMFKSTYLKLSEIARVQCCVDSLRSSTTSQFS